MNYMSEVAKMLGVELGEVFKVGDVDFIFKDIGLVDVEMNKTSDSTLLNILTGVQTIRRNPWKPNENEKFWYVDIDKHIYAEDFCCGYTTHALLYKLSNCYRTKEEAEVNRNKWVAFYSNDEVLDI